MDTPFATPISILGPISPDWTISELIEWLGDDSRQHERALQHPLTVIEAAATESAWRGIPSTVALIRSLTEAARTSPLLGPTTVGALIDGCDAYSTPATEPATESATLVALSERMPTAQVA